MNAIQMLGSAHKHPEVVNALALRYYTAAEQFLERPAVAHVNSEDEHAVAAVAAVQLAVARLAANTSNSLPQAWDALRDFFEDQWFNPRGNGEFRYKGVGVDSPLVKTEVMAFVETLDRHGECAACGCGGCRETK